MATLLVVRFCDVTGCVFGALEVKIRQ